MVHGLRVAGDNGGQQRTGNNTVETGSNGRRVDAIEPASYLAARWRRSSANWFPMLPPLPRDKARRGQSFSSLLLFRYISRCFLRLFSSRSLVYMLVTYVRFFSPLFRASANSTNRHIQYCINVTLSYPGTFTSNFLNIKLHPKFFRPAGFAWDRTTLIGNRRDERLHFEWLRFKVKDRATSTRAILISSRANLHAHALRG